MYNYTKIKIYNTFNNFLNLLLLVLLCYTKAWFHQRRENLTTLNATNIEIALSLKFI